MAKQAPAMGARDAGEVEALVEAGRLTALGELTAGAAHEINNPLFAILTLVDFLLRDAEPGTKTHERLRLIEGSARDIEAVVGRVHGFARARPGDASPFPLEETAAVAVDLVRHASAARDVELVESYPDEPALVAGNPHRLAEVFVNLLLNSLQAMPTGGTVTVAVARDGEEVVGTVADTGPGLPADEVERLFGLWTTMRAGSGLGLAASRAVAEQHGGTLAAAPRAGKGACLVLRLPGASA